MIDKIKNLLNPSASKTTELTFTRDVLVAGVHHAAGTTDTFSQKDAAQLVGSGCAFNPAADDEAAKRQARLAAMIPPRPEPEPLPDGWAGLPPAFASWHELYQRADCLVRRRDAIETKLLGLATRDTLQLGHNPLGGIPDGPGRDAAMAASGRACVRIGVDPDDIVEQRALRDALTRANEAIAEFRHAHGPELSKRKVLCGDELIECHGKLSRLCSELSTVGLAIFNTRVAPLGLAEHKVVSLYQNSADYVRLNAAAPALHDLRLAWSDEGGPRHYVDADVSAMASQLLLWNATVKRLAELLKSAKSELSRAQKAAA